MTQALLGPRKRHDTAPDIAPGILHDPISVHRLRGKLSPESTCCLSAWLDPQGGLDFLSVYPS